MQNFTAKKLTAEEYESMVTQAAAKSSGPKVVPMTAEEYAAAVLTEKNRKESSFELTPEERRLTYEDYERLKEPVEQEPLPTEKFMSNVEETLTKRVEQLVNIRTEQGPYSEGLAPATKMLGLAGATAGLGWDLMGDVFTLSKDGYSLAIPDEIEEPIKQELRDAVTAFTETPVGKEAQKALEIGEDAWFSFKENNPDFALVVESIFNVSGWFRRGPNADPVRKDKTEGSLLDPKYYDPKKRQVNSLTRLERGIWKAISPPKSKEQINTQTTTPQGISRKQEQLLTPKELEQIQTVKKYARVDPSRTDRTNAKSISEAVTKLDEVLKRFLSKQDFEINHSDILSDVKQRFSLYIKENQGLGSKRVTREAQQAFNQLSTILSKRGQSPLEILEARRDLDKWLKEKYGQDFFKAKEGKKGALVRNDIYDEIRRSLNDSLDRAGDATSSNILREQSLLLDALGSINRRLPQGSTTLARISDNLAALNIQLPSTPLAQMALAQSAINTKLLPFFGGIFATVSGYNVGKKMFSKAYYQKELNLLLESLNEGIKTATNPEMVKQLRLDRAAAIEIYKGYMEDAEERMKEERIVEKEAGVI